MLLDVGIRFPFFGIEIESFPKTFSVFGFQVAFYGLIIGIGMVIGILMACREAKVTGQKSDDYIDIALAGIVVGVICARIYYVVFQWSYYKDHLSEIINLRNGGLAIYGGIIGAILTTLVMSKIKKIPVPRILDTVGPSILMGQIIGRWGNFANREAFGSFTDSIFAMQIKVEDAYYTTPALLEKVVKVNGVDFIQVHPTFLYESVWNLCVLIIIILYRRHKKYEGEIFTMYLAGYGLGRFWIEGLRTDPLLIFGTNIPVSQVLSGVIVVVCVALIIYNRKKHKNDTKKESTESDISGSINIEETKTEETK